MDDNTTLHDTVASSPLGHRLMFVLLVVLAFSLFAPTILLPTFKDHCDLLAEEVRLKERVAQLESDVAHQEELAYAFAHDSVVNERLAVLDLRYRRPDEIVIPVLAGNLAKADTPKEPPLPSSRSALHLPDHWPAWALRAETWSARYGLIDLFLDPMLRPVFLLMAGGLTVAAFVLFAPRLRDRRPIQNRSRRGATRGSPQGTTPHPAQ